MSKPSISLCMITKNEAGYLERAIRSVSPVVDEIVVCDTGSTDRTVQIAKKFGARIFHHKWQDDFSKARNASIMNARGDWILVLDADEAIAKKDLPRIRQLVNSDTYIGYFFLLRTYVYESTDIFAWVPLSEEEKEEASYVWGWIPSKVRVRLFRNRLGIVYTGRVNEDEIIGESIKNLMARWGMPVFIYITLGKEKGMRLDKKRRSYIAGYI